MGVDPGLASTGYACLRPKGQRVEVVEKGVVHTEAGLPLESRLEQLFGEMQGIVSRLRPEVVAMEEFYSAYKHPRTAILMAHARGVICLCAALNGVEVVNYAVRAVKQAVTGSGRASKEQVQRMVTALANLKEPPKPLDVADALAVGLCHCLVRGGRGDSALRSGSRRLSEVLDRRGVGD